MPDMAQTYDAQAEHFAKFAPQSFTFVHVERPAYNNALWELCNGILRIKALDLGAGSGRMAQYLSSIGVRPEDITGIEISQNLVDIARRDQPKVNFICGDIRQDIGLPKESFDLITSHMVLEFLDPEGLKDTLDAVRRLLRPGGHFVAITTHPTKMSKSDGVTSTGWFDTSAPWGNDDIIQNWYRTKTDFVLAIEAAGLTLEDLTDLSVPEESERYNKERYDHYKALNPIRLLIKAKK